ncbi:MAG: TolC family protein [Tannerellaceae bacterium]|jgi:outer membrane protein TolC|nr:TolC family protein [Tannerellaceae bacterium]
MSSIIQNSIGTTRVKRVLKALKVLKVLEVRGIPGARKVSDKKSACAFVLLACLFFPAVTKLSAQEVLSLEKCRELALQNNTELQNAGLSVEIAMQTQKEAFTRYFPSVSATGFGIMNSEALMTQTVATGYPPPNDMVAVEMFKKGIIGAVAATQPLFAGGRIVNGNRLAREGVEVSKLQKQMTGSEVLFETERYFWQLVSMKEKMNTLSDAEVMLNRIHSDVGISVEAGVTTGNDLLRVELEQNRLASNRLKLENGIRILKMAFARHIGIEPDGFDIEAPAFEDIAAPFTETQHFETFLLQRPEYRLLEKGVDVAALQMKMEVGKNLPTVAIGAAYNYTRFDKGSPAEMKKDFAMAFVTVTVPISDWWGASHAVKKRRLELRTAENTREEKASLLLLQMQRVHDEMNEAYQHVLLTRRSIAVARENFRMSEDHYKAGISILSDLLDAQNLLQQSRDQYTEAATEYYARQAEYIKVTGK